MSIFLNDSIRRKIAGMTDEASRTVSHDIAEAINDCCGKDNPLSDILDRISRNHHDMSISDCVDNAARQTEGACPDHNTYPYGADTEDIFPCMHCVFRYGDRPSSLARALSDYAHTPNTVGYLSKTILIHTQVCSPHFLDQIENAVADVYFDGDLTVFIVLYNDYGFVNIPFFMNGRWKYDYPEYRGLNQIIGILGDPIFYEESQFSLTGAGIQRRYEIRISGANNIQIFGGAGRRRNVKGDNACRFIRYILRFAENPPDKLGTSVMDASSYTVCVAGKKYSGFFPNDSYSKKLVEVFEELIGSF